MMTGTGNGEQGTGDQALCWLSALAGVPLLALLCGCPPRETFSPPGSLADFNVGVPVPIEIAGDPVYHDEPLFESIPGKAGSHAATITALPDGELLAAWYSYDGPHELDGAAIYHARRPAGGATWSLPQLLVDRPEADGNPVLYSEGEHVWLFQSVVPFGWSTAHIEVQTSEDRGYTWSNPRVITGPIGTNTRYPPIRRADGGLLLPAYDDLLTSSHFFESHDGQSWRLLSTVTSPLPAQIIQPSVVELSDQSLVSVMRGTAGWLWVTRSSDGGDTWTAARDSGFPNPGSSSQILRLASGNLLLVFNDDTTFRKELTVALSADDGYSWSHQRQFIQSESDVIYPSAVQSADGLIHIVYSYGRDQIHHTTFNEAWIVAGEQSE